MTNKTGDKTTSQSSIPAQPSAPVKTGQGNSHPAHGLLNEIDAYFVRAEKLTAADIAWLKAKVSAIRAKL